ncbi:uncharacterized protein LOC130694143 [Daphnia carinata]|uniref:uncharacterized protein LOC130694143 n=1 Tax=Daphnia carinata TaxID=120202 RepID=UPI00257A6AF7|nr:uncharacterized protein LOC130694143 [Daphnia carinata]
MADDLAQMFGRYLRLPDVKAKRVKRVVRAHRVDKKKEVKKALLKFYPRTIDKLVRCESDQDYISLFTRYFGSDSYWATRGWMHLKDARSHFDDSRTYEGAMPHQINETDGNLHDFYVNYLLENMLNKVFIQLHPIMLTRKEKKLLELCGRDSPLDLTEKLKRYIQFGINVNAKDKDGRNALHLLCRYRSNPKLTDAIQLVIKSGIDVKARDNDGMNAIHYLCRYNSSQKLIDAIQILVQSGIDVKAKTKDGSNALYYLCRYSSTPNLAKVVDILIGIGVDEIEGDKYGRNVKYYLEKRDKKEMKIWVDGEAPILGEGGFATVYRGTFGGREVAVKRVLMRDVHKKEEEAMLKLDHPNIVKLFHCEKDENFMYYALELCLASLDQLFLKDDPKKYNGRMPRLIEVFRQLATGLAYIHLKGLIHRDIKPENILILRKSGKRKKIIMKWSDFGLAKSVNEKGLHSWTGVKGTRTWFAPEVLKKLINGKKAENEEFWGTVKSDVFVLGLVFGYILLEGEHLFGSSEYKIHKNIIRKNPVNMKNIDGELRIYYEDDLLQKMLQYDPEQRINMAKVVKQLKSIKKKLSTSKRRAEKTPEKFVSYSLPANLKDRGNSSPAPGNDSNNAKDYSGNQRPLIPFPGQLDLTDKKTVLDCWIELYQSQISTGAMLDETEIGEILRQLRIGENAKNNNEWILLPCLYPSNSSPDLIG